MFKYFNQFQVALSEPLEQESKKKHTHITAIIIIITVINYQGKIERFLFTHIWSGVLGGYSAWSDIGAVATKISKHIVVCICECVSAN